MVDDRGRDPFADVRRRIAAAEQRARDQRMAALRTSLAELNRKVAETRAELAALTENSVSAA